MFTEPMTTPATRKLRMIYGAVTGFLYAPFINIGGVFFTPEISLAVGNIFSYIISPRKKLILKLDGKVNEALGVYDFAFISNTGMNFKPGQYMEWTLAHKSADNRGIRRFFTLASSPTEDVIRLGAKFYDNPSTFKSALSNLESGDEIVASELSGDFIMPSDKNKKLAFIAGGIGVTPFRSMIKYLLDKGEARSAVLLYLNQSESEIAYKEIFDEAKEKLEIKTVYILTDESRISPNWTGRRGKLSESMIKEEVPDYLERTFYLSGPHGMVNAYVQTLQKMGVKKGNIKTDYFPGLV
ncbi:MAG: FAD-dependent oxidoreductase [Candidatus Taylorbacteria bacterium]|nr:FAD-dependent oxidoreductase [Candidatus Taylorbacteria bacterium]